MKGFTLIELLIYIGILAMVLVSTGGFLWNIIFGNIKETSYQEVLENGQFVLAKLTQEIKRAKGINSPAPANSSSSLSLAMTSVASNPTVFDLVDGKLRITKGVSGPYLITSDQVVVSNLKFTNLSYSDTPGTLRIEMTLNHNNPGNRIEYEASINLKSTVTLVPGGAP